MKKRKNKEILHYPTLKTVLMVEEVLKDSDGPMRRSDIKQKLENKIMHQTLNIILEYFENRNMILDTHKGVVWLDNPSNKLKGFIEKGVDVNDL